MGRRHSHSALTPGLLLLDAAPLLSSDPGLLVAGLPSWLSEVLCWRLTDSVG